MEARDRHLFDHVYTLRKMDETNFKMICLIMSTNILRNQKVEIDRSKYRTKHLACGCLVGSSGQPVIGKRFWYMVDADD